MNTIYTLDEAAQKLGFSRKTLQREINAGCYPDSFKVGKRSCTNSTDVEAYLQRVSTEQDHVALSKANEAADRIRCRRELETWQRNQHLAFEMPNPHVRPFSPNDPNRLP